MKKLLGIVVLGLLWCNTSFADEISEFEIEGITLGESLLDHMSEEEIIYEIEDNKDPLFSQAVELISREKKVSTSFLQRHLQIGYNRAARIIDKLENEQIISSANHAGKREIFIDKI